MKEKIQIYQVLPRLFGNTKTKNKWNGTLAENGSGKLSDFDSETLEIIREMGFTHIWYTGLLEHATKTDYTKYGIEKDHPAVIKGNAGSPYAIKDYYDICPDLADDVDRRVEEFEQLVERTHSAGLRVIMDFVPNHVARQYRSDKNPKGISNFGANDDVNRDFVSSNNFYYLPNQRLELDFTNAYKYGEYLEYPAKVTGNDKFSNHVSVSDWYETVKLNYGVDYLRGRISYFAPIPDTWIKMKDILQYWISKGVDAFRCDMIEMVPVAFWSWVISALKSENKEILFIGEAYSNNLYYDYIENGKFDYLYDKVDLYDTLRDVICGHRPTSDITYSWQRTEHVRCHMLNFLENHDEQRIGSDFFAKDPRKAIPALHTMCFMNTNPVMIYAGQELGERGMDEEGFSGLDGRTTIFDYWTVDTLARWKSQRESAKQKLTKEEEALRSEYVKTLQLSRQEKCLAEGSFYDLMYANYDNKFFDSSKQYVFLRSVSDEFLLVVSNFSDQRIILTVNIPEEAYDFMKIMPQQIQSVQNISTGEKLNLEGLNLSEVALPIAGYDSTIIRFSTQPSIR